MARGRRKGGDEGVTLEVVGVTSSDGTVAVRRQDLDMLLDDIIF